MFKCLTIQALRLAARQLPSLAGSSAKALIQPFPKLSSQARNLCLGNTVAITKQTCPANAYSLCRALPLPCLQLSRKFHAKGSKVKYLDFRYKMKTGHLRSHLLIIRHQKMKKHKRRKWRKKYKCLLAKMRLKREIAKEKTFRVELLNMIQKAEQFNPKEYALNKIREMNSRPKELTKQEAYEQLKELIRVNRYQVTYIKPKHRRINTYGFDS